MDNRELNGTVPVVSVVLPTYNRAALVGRAIESVLQQDMADFELVIVDDSSTDDTLERVAEYLIDPRVHLVQSTTNVGGGAARNLGVRSARAPLIAFQDSDDYWLPYKLSRQIEALEGAPEHGVCYCGSIFYGPEQVYYLPRPNLPRYAGDMSAAALVDNPASTQTLLVRRSEFDAVGGFRHDLKRYQDWDLVLRLAQRTPFVFLEQPLVLIFHSAVSLSTNPVNDAIYREAILEDHRQLFSAYPSIRAEHEYIALRAWQRAGHRRTAASRAVRLAATPSGARHLVGRLSPSRRKRGQVVANAIDSGRADSRTEPLGDRPS